MLAATLHNIPVECSSDETAHFNPPPGMTCAQYAGQFADLNGGTLIDGSLTSDCQYCPLRVGDQYLASLNITADEKWRDFGIFLVFVFTNYLLVYFFIWSCRVKHWSFGLGYVFGGLGKMVGYVKSPITKLVSRKKA